MNRTRISLGLGGQENLRSNLACDLSFLTLDGQSSDSSSTKL